MTSNLTKLCDELEALAANCETIIFYAPADGGVPELNRTFDPVRLRPLIDAARKGAYFDDLDQALKQAEHEVAELRERIKELERELKERGG